MHRYTDIRLACGFAHRYADGLSADALLHCTDADILSVLRYTDIRRGC